MKKTSLLCMFFVLTSCTSYSLSENVNYQPEEQVVIPETVDLNVPCSYSCFDNNCSNNTIEPLVLKPRVTETYSEYKKQRNCPEDTPAVVEQQQTKIPDLPEIYVISANRTVNSMLNDAKAVFQDKTVKVFVNDTTRADADLPGGVDKGVRTIKKRLSDTNTVLLANKASSAEYVIKTTADWFDTPTKNVPAVKYTLLLESKDGIKLGEWTEVVHQAEGDRSWW